ncbi:MAG: GNAT family N-acetyltransferase, partial [Sphingobacteriales bacterium]|nr:GNAT family N-acetyltransferase [Sphingobacteriales bacterium]
MKMIYREATLHDAGDIDILNNQLGYPSEAEVLKENLSKVLSLPDNYLLVVEYEQKIIAWLNVR